MKNDIEEILERRIKRIAKEEAGTPTGAQAKIALISKEATRSIEKLAIKSVLFCEPKKIFMILEYFEKMLEGLKNLEKEVFKEEEQEIEGEEGE